MTSQFYLQPSDLPPVKDRKGMAIASLVLGLVSPCIVVIPLIGWLGLLASIIGLILGILGLRSSLKPVAIAGIVLCSIDMILGLLNLLFFSLYLIIFQALKNFQETTRRFYG